MLTVPSHLSQIICPVQSALHTYFSQPFPVYSFLSLAVPFTLSSPPFPVYPSQSQAVPILHSPHLFLYTKTHPSLPSTPCLPHLFLYGFLRGYPACSIHTASDQLTFQHLNSNEPRSIHTINVFCHSHPDLTEAAFSQLVTDVQHLRWVFPAVTKGCWILKRHTFLFGAATKRSVKW